MAVAVSATGTSSHGASVTAFDYTGITVGAGDNALVVILCLQAGSNPGNPVCHWDSAGTNQAMLRVGVQLGGGGADTVSLHGLVNPTPGNLNLHITWTAAAIPDVCALSFTGVLTSGGNAAAFINFASNNLAQFGLALNVTVTNQPNSIVVNGAIGNANSYSSPSGTQIFNDTNFTGTTSAAGQWAAPSATPYSFLWTASASTATAQAGMEVVPAPAGGGAAAPTDVIGVGATEW